MGSGFGAPSEAGWTAAYGARLAWSPDPAVALAAEAWRADASGRVVRGAGLLLVVVPWAGRRWPVDPALLFGLEGVGSHDGEDRSLAFVSGVGLRRGLGARWSVEADVRNHFLTVAEPPVGDVAEARDANLWEARFTLAARLGRR